jgi:predicted Zn-dependent protease
VAARTAWAWVCLVLGGGLAAAVAVPGCGSGGGGEGPGHRRQSLALTPRQELSLGEQAYQEVLKKEHPLPDTDPRVKRVRQIGKKIEEAVAIESLQREINLRVKGYTWEWQYNVLRNDQVNAFCLPGGKVAVYAGLLPVAQNDDQLATVMGHEIAHALAHHASERIARQQMWEHAVDAVNGAMGRMDPDLRKKLIGLLGVGGLAYDRQQESEADHIGLFLMTFAGYDPDEAVRFWERMQEASRGHGSPPEVLSDHPSDAHRIAQMKKWLVAAKAAKQAYDAGRIAK